MNRGIRGVVRICLGATASLVLFAVLGELAVRQLDLVDRLNAYARDLYIPTGFSDVPYRLRPGFVRTAEEAGFTVRVNRHGLRGAEIENAPAPGMRRVLVLGDSVVHGHALEENDTFPIRLEEELRRRGVEDVEVLNGGTSGWNTTAEVAFLEGFGLALEPDVVILGVSLNDFAPTPSLTARGVLTNDARERERTPWLANHSELYLVLRFAARKLLEEGSPREPAAAAPRPDAEKPSKERIPWDGLNDWIAERHAEFYASPEGPEWAAVRSALARIAGLARDNDFELRLVLFPEAFQFDFPEPKRDAQRAWRALCAELALDCIDLWPAFAEAHDPVALFHDVQHPGPEGHVLAARVVAGELVSAWRGTNDDERDVRSRRTSRSVRSMQ